MGTRGDLLDQVMSETGTTQSRLSRLSGVHQPSISQFVSGRTELSHEMLDRLLECMGHRLEVTRRNRPAQLHPLRAPLMAVAPGPSVRLSQQSLDTWLPHIESRLDPPSHPHHRLATHPEPRALDQTWSAIAMCLGIRRVLNGLDRDSIEMREVSPLGGLLGEQDRLTVLATV